MDGSKPVTIIHNQYIELHNRPGSRLEIAHGIYSPTIGDGRLSSLQQYFAYYTEELGLLQSGISQQSWQSAELACATYEEIFYIVNVLRQNPMAKRPEIRYLLNSNPGQVCSESSLNRAINLALRLWLMVNVQETKFKTLRHGVTCIEWNDTQTLRKFFIKIFPQSCWKITARESRMGPHFTAAFMRRVCGLKIEWTTSLHDHLRLDRRRKALKVFPYKCHLQALMNDHDGTGDKTNNVLPPKLLQETILSLDLLFPFWDPKTVSLLEGEQQTFHNLGPFEATKSLNLMDFVYWRDRLLELHEEVFLSPPVSWAQLWRDDRNPQQFWMFWIAMVILGLTVISNITSIIQAWASVRAPTAT